MILEDGVNGRLLSFDAHRIARVLSEFVSGAWKPRPAPMKHALDSNAYATQLLEELRLCAQPPATEAVWNTTAQTSS
jgi:hypothetical protein